MTGVTSLGQAIEGLKRIRDEIVKRVGARGVQISRDNFTWNGGDLSFSVLHDPVRMDVRTGPCHRDSAPKCLTDWRARRDSTGTLDGTVNR